LGDYKKDVVGEAKAKTIWVPGKDVKDKPKEATNEEKEQEIIKLLLGKVKIEIPKILIDEEVNARLSSLLDRIERLGLNLDSYLASVGKNPEILRKEYEIQSQNTISLELILNKIAEEEKIEITEAQIDEVIKTTSGDPKLAEKLDTPEQRRMIKAVLGRKAALDLLVKLL
jgi:trigger factor